MMGLGRRTKAELRVECDAEERIGFAFISHEGYQSCEDFWLYGISGMSCG